MPEQKEVEDVQKEFMDLLMEVKVTVSELSVKFDNIGNMKETLESTRDTAKEANARSIQNEKDIESVEKDMKNKADKDDVDRIVKEKDNWKRNLPAWVAVAISAIALLLSQIS